MNAIHPDMSEIAAARLPKELVRFENVSLSYGRRGNSTLALSPTNLSIHDGEFVALVGPSGCGKSTILKLVSELIKPTTGNIVFSGRDLGTNPARVGMAFQSSTLLPWLTIRDNVMLPLKIVPPFRQQYRAKRRGAFAERVLSLLAQVGLEDFAENIPGSFRVG